MGLLLENFKMATSSIRANKMRSFLTMLGIIIGIASVITITSVGESLTASMNKFMRGFGKNSIMIYINYGIEDYPDDNHKFFPSDVDFLKEKFKGDIVYSVPSINYRNIIKKGLKQQTLIINAADYNFLKDVRNYKIIYGRDMQPSDVSGRKNVIVVNKEFAQKLYSKENIVGEEIVTTIADETKTLKIIGVYDKEKTLFDNLESGDATEAYIPYTIVGDYSSSLIDIKIAEHLNPKTYGEKIKSFIARYKRADEKLYVIRTLEEQAGMINNMFSMLSLGLGAIAAISLVVGGIGIMNIMLVSVTERTKEIGIRKSLGARKKDILMQFLIESVLLSGAGGIIGTIIGLGLSSIAAGFMKVDPTVSVSSIAIAVLFSFTVGIFFGLFPANKAAKLDPIDALRYE